ncbi:MAG: sulfatase [Acidobacteria bacterium]|nr:sulfatase [Acidobacteriota bacterium]
MNRREFLANGSMAAAVAKLPRTTAKRPNVLYILCDEWRAQSLGYAGDPNVKTPAIDALAAQSVNVSQMISGLPVCCPYRATLMTGQYPLTHGVFINDVPLEPKDTTLGEAFQHAGYKTGYIGKWHLYGSPDGHYGRRESYIPPDKRFGFEYWKACECTHDYNKSIYYEGNDPTPKIWPGYDAIAQTDDACNFLADHAKQKDPFFLVLSFGPPHFPLHTAPADDQAMWKGHNIVLRPNVPKELAEQAKNDLRGYYAHMTALDECVKKLMEMLDKQGLADDTIVIFTADHGDMMRSQGLTTKQFPWEESLRVPFLIRSPKQLGRNGRENKLLMSAVDIMPTLLGMCSIPVPKTVQGTDYSRVLRNQSHGPLPTSAFLNLPASFSMSRRYGIAAYRGVRTARYTYVRSEYGPWLLYDNERDPYQMHNLIGKPEAAATQKQLETELQSWLHRLNDEFLPGREYLERAHLLHYGEAQEKIGHVKSPWGDWESTLPQTPLAS